MRPFTLALSSGFFGFYAHVGFLKALREIGWVPSAFSGSSAGAIIAAAAARGLSVAEIEKLTLQVSRKEFWDPYLGFGFLRGRRLQEFLAQEIGADFNTLEKPLRISVFDIATRSTQVFTDGRLARVIRASCAVPMMFHPVRLNRRFYWDGGIQDKMGIHGIPDDHLILSHYLESRNRVPRDEKTIAARGGNLIQVQLRGLPRSGPFALQRGPEIIAAAHRAAFEVLRGMDF